MSNHNDKYVKFNDPIKLAQYLSELARQCVEYKVTEETDGSYSVIIIGF